MTVRPLIRSFNGVEVVKDISGLPYPSQLLAAGGSGDWWDRDNSRMWQESAESTAVTTDEDRIGSIRGGYANTQLTSATTLRPYYEVITEDPRLEFRGAQRLDAAGGVFNFAGPTFIWRGYWPASASLAMILGGSTTTPFYNRFLSGPPRYAFRTDGQGTLTSLSLAAFVATGQLTTVIHRITDGKLFFYNTTHSGEVTTGLATPSYSFSESCTLRLGGNAGASLFMTAETYFWMLISRNLTDTEIGNLATYLDETYP